MRAGVDLDPQNFQTVRGEEAMAGCENRANGKPCQFCRAAALRAKEIGERAQAAPDPRDVKLRAAIEALEHVRAMVATSCRPLDITQYIAKALAKVRT